MTKKTVSHLLKCYPYIIRAVKSGEKFVEIKINGRREHIEINDEIMVFVEIFQMVYKREENSFVKKLIEINIIQGRTNLSAFSDKPLDRSTYYRYKQSFVDKIYHCCIYKGLTTFAEILDEKIVVNW